MVTSQMESELSRLREEAIDAGLEADAKETEARKLRRRATAKFKAYEKALQEAQETR